MKRGDHGSGGVTIMVDESLKCREVRRSKNEDLLWICIECETEKWFVGGVYLVPPSASRRRKADELVEEVGRDVARFCLEGQVILAGDWNCKIGHLESVGQGDVFERKSVSEKVDSRGKRIIELLNMSDMVVLNGVQGTRAQYTCKGVRGDGIDYVAVSCALVERTSQLEYGCEKELDTDHVALSCKIKLLSSRRLTENKKNKQAAKVSFKLVGSVNPSVEMDPTSE